MGGKTEYPKGSPHPSRRVGETDNTSWPEHTDCEYPGGGASATTYNGDKSKTMECRGNSSSKPEHEYKKKSRSFGTEGFR